MENFNVDDFLTKYKPITEGDGADKKYPSAYIGPLIKDIIIFINWIISYINTKISDLNGQMNTKFTAVDDKFENLVTDIEDIKKEIKKLDAKIDANLIAANKHTDDEIRRLRDDLGI